MPVNPGGEISEGEKERLLKEREEIMRKLQELNDDDDDDSDCSFDNVEEELDELTTPKNEVNGRKNVEKKEEEKPTINEVEKRELRFEEFDDQQSSIDSTDLPATKNTERDEFDDELLQEYDELKCPYSGGAEEGDEEEEGQQVQKIVLEKYDDDRYKPLPEGWTMFTHNSGMPLYLHRNSRVVTLARPYKVTTDMTIRNHRIPLSAIPCMNRKESIKKEEEKNRKIKERLETAAAPQSSASAAKLAAEILLNVNTKIVEVDEEPTISPEEFNQYCSSIFKFKEIMVAKFKKEMDKGAMRREKMLDNVLQRAGFTEKYEEVKSRMKAGDMLMTAPSGATLIDVTPLDNRRQRGKKPFLLNPMGRTTVMILNEFMQRLVKGKIEYICEDNRNVTCPYKATAYLSLKAADLIAIGGSAREKLALLNQQAEISGTSLMNNDMKKFPIGRGIGHSKKVARLSAAKDALSVLVPPLYVNDEFVCEGVREKVDPSLGCGEVIRGFNEEAMKVLDVLKIDSPKIFSICQQFGVIKPYALLREAVTRSIRWNGTELIVKKELVGAGTQKSRVSLILGDLEQTAEEHGVKVAMQIAAQLLLRKMHPELECYGSYLRLYAAFEEKTQKDNAKRHHDQVVRLQNKGSLLQPNHAVLNKLKEEMKNVTLIYPPRKFLYGLAGSQTPASVVPLSPNYSVQYLNIGTQTDLPSLSPIPPFLPPTYGYSPLPSGQPRPPMPPMPPSSWFPSSNKWQGPPRRKRPFEEEEEHAPPLPPPGFPPVPPIDPLRAIPRPPILPLPPSDPKCDKASIDSRNQS
ncbi:unnamed protein product [Caenorhabditis bovis]|uniref:DRBM domain-containing protein n=1 Tax=Caenorhabditis bovis TaxID=2654633 RepID=A0A8S1F4D0_9PELO|nr:unnamed protein product [Caenorhabditis bovis]